MTDTALIRNRAEIAAHGPDALGYVRVNAEAMLADTRELCDEVDRLQGILAAAREYVSNLWSVGEGMTISRLHTQLDLEKILGRKP